MAHCHDLDRTQAADQAVRTTLPTIEGETLRCNRIIKHVSTGECVEMSIMLQAAAIKREIPSIWTTVPERIQRMVRLQISSQIWASQHSGMAPELTQKVEDVADVDGVIKYDLTAFANKHVAVAVLAIYTAPWQPY